MKTTHTVYFGNSRIMNNIQPETIDLIVTSPPYPMIEMWDNFFSEQNQEIDKAIKSNDVLLAFELMHQELDQIWNECYRILKYGGLACINIGDATRTINNDFALYPNHARIVSHMLKIGFSALPTIIWRKQTNAPNKFMGSGMFPPGAYVTLEHEYILIMRKGSKMSFKTEAEKIKRRESAFFWEERNSWFSDVWMDLKGTSQKLNDNRIRFRSAAFPFELPYRLINMFSVKGGIVLDPFLGTGTTMLAAMSSARNSVGFEIDPNFGDVIINQANKFLPFANEVIENRLEKHLKFIQAKMEDNYNFKYNNKYYGFPVMTKQEIDLSFNNPTSVNAIADNYIDVLYSDKPQEIFSRACNTEVDSDINSKIRDYSKKSKQKSFF